MCQTFVHSTSRENSVSELLEWSKMNYCVFVINAWKGRAGQAIHFQVRVLLIGFTGAEMNDFGREILVLISFDKPQFGLYV